MSSDLEKELRAILQGKPPFERSRTPEPEIFVELIPLLPENHLEWLFSFTGNYNFIGRKNSKNFFTALINRLSESSRKNLLDYSLTNVELVPPAFLDEALSAARNQENIAALINLAQRVPGKMKREITREAFELISEATTDKFPVFDIFQVESLAKLASNLTQPEKKELLEKTLNHSEIYGCRNASVALSTIVPVLDEPLRSKAVEKAFAEIEKLWGEEKARVIAILAPFLPKHLIQDVLNMAKGFEDKQLRFASLAGLIPFFSKSYTDNSVYQEMLLSVPSPPFERSHTDWQLKVFLDSVKQLPEKQKNELFSKVLSAIDNTSWEENKVRDLIEVADYIPTEIIAEALKIALKIENNWWRALALKAVYPFLEKEEQKKIFPEVDAVSGEIIRQKMLQLPEEKRDPLLRELLTSFLHNWGGAPPPPSRMRLKPKRTVTRMLRNQKGYSPDLIMDALDKHERINPVETKKDTKKEVINTYFSSLQNPKENQSKYLPLQCNTSYYFVFESAEYDEESIEVVATSVPVDKLPKKANLKITLFGFEGEIKITPNRDIGKMKIMPNGTLRVLKEVEKPDVSSVKRKKSLFFLVKTPDKEGVFRLRCNIYYEQNLVQSRLIKAAVSIQPNQFTQQVLTSVVEYSLNRSLNQALLKNMKPKSLSIMLNDNEDGTHSFRMVGVQGFKDNKSFSAKTLIEHVQGSRGALRRASWGNEESWTEDREYRYSKPNSSLLKEDLILFALRGARFWFALVGQPKMAPKHSDSAKLANMMLKHTSLEFAIKDHTEASYFMFPAAMIYDYDIDTNLKPDCFEICRTFKDAVKQDTPLEQTACFKGSCPSRGEPHIICPSGFWGFRHSIGVPFGINQDTDNEITYQDAPELTISAYPFETWDSHKKTLQRLKVKGWNEADSISDTLMKLKTTNPHLIYFYCHGGLGGSDNNIPYIKVRRDELKDSKLLDGITPDNLRNVSWESTQPLVFINGCKTAALEPKLSMNFVDSFLRANAVGVIGTEVAIFEVLGREFAEDCLRRFIVEGKTIGDAVREARLKLLKQENPLGLIYTVYASADLHLKKTN